MKRIIPILAVVFLLLAMAVPAFAAENEYTVSGVWVLNENPILNLENGYQLSQSVSFTVSGYECYAIEAYKSTDGSAGYLRFKTDAFSYSWTPYHVISGGWHEGIEEYKMVDFGTAPQVVSDEFYVWLTTHATQQASEDDSGDSSGTVTITYNGSVIASLSAGQTATLNCAGKKMVGDIVISVSADSGESGGGAN